jgi:hypothetical protein
MHIDWQIAYSAALGEQDPAKISPACEHARILINGAAVELVKEGHSHDSPERDVLEEALRNLYFHQYPSA